MNILNKLKMKKHYFEFILLLTFTFCLNYVIFQLFKFLKLEDDFLINLLWVFVMVKDFLLILIFFIKKIWFNKK